MALSHSPSIVMNGLVLCLDAANPKSYPGSGTTWTDLSGNGNNGTLTNGPTYSGSSGGYIDFDGTDDYVTGTIDGFNPDSGCTLETFVRRPTTPGAWRTYFNIKPNSGSNTPFFEMRTSGASLTTTALYFNGTDYFTTAYTINSTDFYHMIATYDGAGNINLYINGSLYDTKTSVSSFAIGANPTITIGRAYSNDRPTNIEVGVCKVYNRALTALEVQQNFNALRSRFGI